jgi:RibD C-terminal domain
VLLAYRLPGEPSTPRSLLRRKLRRLGAAQLLDRLAQTLICNRLVDEYRLWVFPIALGTGKRLFADGTVPTAFERADVRLTEAGVTVLTFRPLGEPRLGTHEIEAGAEAIKLAE